MSGTISSNSESKLIVPNSIQFLLVCKDYECDITVQKGIRVNLGIVSNVAVGFSVVFCQFNTSIVF